MQMNLKLVRKLIETGVIRQHTEIEASYYGVDIAGVRNAKVVGTFFIEGVRINEKTGTVIFDTISTKNGAKRTISNADVLSIDGMDLTRLAANYNMDDKGGHVPEPTRRGRKPGAKRAAEEAAMAANG